ncbi:hypothetical protein NMG60_11005322 [Bertholletia excelsa]
MLQIRLSKNPSAEGGTVPKPVTLDSVTVACPDHLVLADLPVAKGLGSAPSASLIKIVGRRSRRQLGERVHFCVRCDFPIAIYGRLNPCDHVFCLDCARSDSVCYLCDERIQKIQTIKLMEGIYICAAPHCLKSFLKKTDFESHIHKIHADLLHPNTQKAVGNELEAASLKQPTPYDSSAQAPYRPIFPSNSSSQTQDREDEACQPLPRDQQPPNPTIQQPKLAPPFLGQNQNYPSNPQNTQQGNLSETLFPNYPPTHTHQPPNFSVPVNSNPIMASPPLISPNYPPFPPEGAQMLYGAAHEMARPQSAPEGPIGGVNFSDYSFPSMQDPQGRDTFFQGHFGQHVGGLHPPPSSSTDQMIEIVHGSNSIDPRRGKGVLAPQPSPYPLPPPPRPPHFSQQKDYVYLGEMDRDE